MGCGGSLSVLRILYWYVFLACLVKYVSECHGLSMCSLQMSMSVLLVVLVVCLVLIRVVISLCITPVCWDLVACFNWSRFCVLCLVCSVLCMEESPSRVFAMIEGILFVPMLMSLRYDPVSIHEVSCCR